MSSADHDGANDEFGEDVESTGEGVVCLCVRQGDVRQHEREGPEYEDLRLEFRG